MKRLVFIITLLSILANAKSQERSKYWSIDTLSSFNQPHNPFSDPLSMWLLRQNLTLNAFQADVGTELYISENNDNYNFQTYFVNYLPVYNRNSFSAMIGTSYLKMSILSKNDSLNKNLQDMCLLWLPIQYTRNKLKFTFLYEHMLKGDAKSLYTKTGNTKRAFIISSYNFNLKWQLSVMAAYLETQMENKPSKLFVPAFQLRYNPSEKLVMITGAPVLFAFEWSPIQKIDLAFSQILLEHTEGYIRYSISENIGISAHYKSTGYSSADTYFKSESILLDNQQIVYNNLTQIQKSIALKLGVKTLNNIGIILTGGYKIGQNVDLYNNENKVGNANGIDKYYIGLNIQHLKYF